MVALGCKFFGVAGGAKAFPERKLAPWEAIFHDYVVKNSQNIGPKRPFLPLILGFWQKKIWKQSQKWINWGGTWLEIFLGDQGVQKPSQNEN